MSEAFPAGQLPCPKCSKPILALARKCKHCKEWIGEAAPAETVANNEASASENPDEGRRMECVVSPIDVAVAGETAVSTELSPEPPSRARHTSRGPSPAPRRPSKLQAVAGVAGLFGAIALVVGLSVWRMRQSEPGLPDAGVAADTVVSPDFSGLAVESPRISDVLLLTAFMANNQTTEVQLYHPVVRLAPPNERTIALDDLLVLSEPFLLGDTLAIGMAVDSSGINQYFYQIRLIGDTASVSRSSLPPDFPASASQFGISSSGKYLAYVRYREGRVSGVVRTLQTLEFVGETSEWRSASDSQDDRMEWTNAEELTFVLRVLREDGQDEAKVHALRIVDGFSPSLISVSERSLEVLTEYKSAATTSGDALDQSKAREEQGAASDVVYLDAKVDKPAAMAPGAAGPVYPDVLRSAGTEGTVVAQFVVDTTGRVDMATFTVLKTDNDLFSTSVRNALQRMRFLPAELDGRRVRQLVQQPFQFSLNR